MCLVQIQESPLQMLKTPGFHSTIYIGMCLDTSLNGMKRRLSGAFGVRPWGRGVYPERGSFKVWQFQAEGVQAVGGDYASGPWMNEASGVGESKVGKMVAPRIMGNSRIAQLTRHLPPADGLWDTQLPPSQRNRINTELHGGLAPVVATISRLTFLRTKEGSRAKT